VEDITDPEDPDFQGNHSKSHAVDLLEEGFFVLDENLDSDSEDEGCEDECADESVTDADIAAFTEILAEAQLAAVKAEQLAKAEKPNRKRHYTGNSKRTRQYHAQKRQKLRESGQPFIQSFFAKKTDIEIEQVEHQGDLDSLETEDNELVGIIAENGEEHLRRLFPEDDCVRLVVPRQASLDCSMPYVKSAKERVEDLLQEMRKEKHHQENISETLTDVLLNGLSHKDFPALRRARVWLNLESRNKKIDVFFRARITAMAGTLNLYLDPMLSYSWRECSLLAAKTAGHGIYHARNIRTWIRQYLTTQKLPLHRYGKFRSSILEDEDLARDIQLHLTEIAKEGYIRAQDVVDYIATPEVQERLGTLGNARPGKISLRTAQRWLKKLSWRYAKKKNGMYIDGHEREDVVEYRKKFVQRWKEYEKRFVIYDNDGKVVSPLQGFAVPGVRFRLILVTHDESTFYENDRRKTKWVHEKEKAVAEKKGEGQSIMASDFLTVEWGRLTDGDKYVNGCQSLRIRTDKQEFFSSLGRLG
jgi:hypothetical protein